MTAEQRFWAKVDTTGGLLGCWPWQAATDPDGYGRFNQGDNVTVKANRYALALSLGRPIGEGLHALHTCDNPPCCNPAHLYEGTPRQNADDKMARGRWGGGWPSGERHHSARLTEDQVREIRRRAVAERLSESQLGTIYGVGQTTISKILRGKIWKSVAA